MSYITWGTKREEGRGERERAGEIKTTSIEGC
jgi:hypothetical protein